MQLEIVTPDKNVFAGEVDYVEFPGSDGTFGVLNNHAAMIATLKKGVIEVKIDKKQESFEINGGVVEVLKNKVIVLAE